MSFSTSHFPLSNRVTSERDDLFNSSQARFDSLAASQRLEAALPAELDRLVMPIAQSLSTDSEHDDSSSNDQLISSKKQPLFIAITGRFNNNGEDRTNLVSKEGSETERVFLDTYKVAEELNIGIDGQFITPGKNCDSSVKTATDFVDKNHQSGEPIIIYGYSNGGRCAIDVATALKEQQRNIDLLLTVDATDAKSPWLSYFSGDHNSTLNTVIPANVAVNHNFYQTEECGIRSCPHGEEHQPEVEETTEVFNHLTAREQLTDDKYKDRIHRYMEEINKQSIMNVISSVLTDFAENEK